MNAGTPLTNQQSRNHRNLSKAVDLFLFGSPNELDAVRLQRVRVIGIIIQLISLIDPRSSWAGIPYASRSVWVPDIDISWLEDSRSTAVLAANVSFLAVPSIVAAGPVQIIYCSVVWMATSIVCLLNTYSNPGLLVACNAVCLSTGTSCSGFQMFTLAYDHDGWTLSQTSHVLQLRSLPIASLRTSSRFIPFTLCSHGF